MLKEILIKAQCTSFGESLLSCLAMYGVNMLDRDFLMAGFSGVAFSSAEKQQIQKRSSGLELSFTLHSIPKGEQYFMSKKREQNTRIKIAF